MGKVPAAERAAADVAALGDLAREELAEIWAKRFGRAPPKGCGRRFLELAVAYGIQEKAFGGLKPEARKALVSEMDPADDNATSHRKKRRRAIATVNYP